MTVRPPFYSELAEKWRVSWWDGERHHSAWYKSEVRARKRYTALQLEGYIALDGALDG